jgi:outer membrane protein TolC
MKSLAVMIALALAAAPAAADTYTPPALFAQPPELPAGYDASNALRLDLPGALQLALEHNIGLAIERRQVDAAGWAVEGATGAMYDTTVTASYARTDSASPPTTIQAGSAGEIISTVTDTWSTAASQRLPTGGVLSWGVGFNRTFSSSGTAVLPLTYYTTTTLGVTQPLLHGFSFDRVIPEMSILSAKMGVASERLNLVNTATQLVQQTENAYWDVVFAMYAYHVAVDSKREADDTFALTRRQIEAGTLATSELPGAEATMASRQVAVVRAATQVETAWDALRGVLDLPRAEWARPILPVDVPVYDATRPPSVDDALATAIAHRTDFAQIKLDLESARLAIRKAENDRLPEIDLTLGISLAGQGAGAAIALSGLASGDAPTWMAGVSVSWTPRGRASKAAVELAKLQRVQKLAARDQHVVQVWNEVRSAVRGKQSAALEVATAAKARELASTALVTENRKYVAGTSSTTTIAQKQQDVVNDELAELQALVGNARAETALLVATGQLLDARHVQLN